MPIASLQPVLRIVADAASIARAIQHDLDNLRQITKDDRSPVTVADFAVQAIVAMGLGDLEGSPRIVGEEHAGVLRRDDQARVRAAVVDAVRKWRPKASEDEVLDAIDACDHDATAPSYWTLDPIDGTKGFLRGEQYAIALGFIESGAVKRGVMGCPNLPADPDAPLDGAGGAGSIYAAIRGEGAWQIDVNDISNPTPIQAATFNDDITEIRTCESVEKSHTKQSDTQRVLDALGARVQPVRLDSQCKYALIARGQADAYLRLPTSATYIEKIWDHAAGSLIATEAGAVVTDMTGAPLDFTRGERLTANRGIICAARGLHERIIGVIDELGIGAERV